METGIDMDWDQKLTLLEEGLRKNMNDYIETGEERNAEVFSDLLETLTKYKFEGFTAEAVIEKTYSQMIGWLKQAIKDLYCPTPEDKEYAEAYSVLSEYVNLVLYGPPLESNYWSDAAIMLEHQFMMKANFYDILNIYPEIVQVYLDLLKILGDRDVTDKVRVSKVYSTIQERWEEARRGIYSEDKDRRTAAEALYEVNKHLRDIFLYGAVRNWEAKAVELEEKLVLQSKIFRSMAETPAEIGNSFLLGAEVYEELSAELLKSKTEGKSAEELILHLSRYIRAQYKKKAEAWSFDDKAVRSEAFAYASADNFVQSVIYGSEG